MWALVAEAAKLSSQEPGKNGRLTHTNGRLGDNFSDSTTWATSRRQLEEYQRGAFAMCNQDGLQVCAPHPSRLATSCRLGGGNTHSFLLAISCRLGDDNTHSLLLANSCKLAGGSSHYSLPATSRRLAGSSSHYSLLAPSYFLLADWEMVVPPLLTPCYFLLATYS